jgi:uncharacterized protein YndB with AHSA1/START domain
MATTKPSLEAIIHITRTFAAPREKVFRAWTEPQELKKWWAAGPGYTTPIAEVDLRVGGRYRLGMKPPDKDVVHIVGGAYREVQRPSRLVYTWVWEGSSAPGTLVTVEFRDQGASTEVTLVHEPFADSQSREQHLAGWTGCLDRLTNLVEGR